MPDTGAPSIRTILGRIGLAAGLPLTLLAGLEFVLGWAGFGVPSDFFVARRIGDRAVWTDNPPYTRPVFGPGLERNPFPFVIPREKAPGTLRIFVLGESAALGDPIPEFSFSRQLAAMLREAWPGRPVEVINTAVTAINSPVIRQIARDAARRQPDAFILYMGNNEVVGPFGPGTVFSPAYRSLLFIRGALALRRTRVNQLLQENLARLTPPRRWEGMEMFLRRTVAATDPRLAGLYRNFEANVEDCVQAGLEAGAGVVLGTVAVNLRDCAPLASRPRPGMATGEVARLQRLVRASLAADHADEALDLAGQALALDDQYADAYFVQARALEAGGHHEAARVAYQRALELDALRFRADTGINRALRAVAARPGRGRLVLADVEQLAAERSPHGLPGDAFFYDHVHLTFAAQYQVAALLFERLQDLGLVPPEARPLGQDETARAVAWTEWTRYRTEEEMYVRRLAPPFSHQLQHAETADRLAERMLELKLGLTTGEMERARAISRRALDRNPGDAVLAVLLAEVNLETGQPRAAADAFALADGLQPYLKKPKLCRAAALALAGETKQALTLLNPGQPELASGRLGEELVRMGRFAQALPLFQDAWRSNPHDRAALVNLGTAKATAGDAPGAIGLLREAVRLDANDDIAQANLGLALVQNGRWHEGVDALQTAARLNPRNAETLNSLATVLQASNRLDEARALYRAALLVRPLDSLILANAAHVALKCRDGQEAWVLLDRAARAEPANLDLRRRAAGVALSQERWLEASRHYQVLAANVEATADDHYRLGYSLAQLTNYPAALVSLKRAVDLDARHALAHVNLAVVLQRIGEIKSSLDHYRAACSLQPGQKPWRRDLAWLLATHPDPSFRNPEEAYTWAAPLVEGTAHPQWSDWDIMATVAAARNRPAEASAYMHKALESAPDEAVRIRLHQRRVQLAIEP